MAKHKAKKPKTPLKWRTRRWQNQWRYFIKPKGITRLRAAQSLIKAFLRKYE